MIRGGLVVSAVCLAGCAPARAADPAPAPAEASPSSAPVASVLEPTPSSPRRAPASLGETDRPAPPSIRISVQRDAAGTRVRVDDAHHVLLIWPAADGEGGLVH